jgi:hypothetical protein
MHLLACSAAAAAGGAVWRVLALTYVSQVLDKAMEELLSVNETIHANLQQFSLVPFTEDAGEYRDAVEGWSLHFQEVSRMAQSALYDTIEDAALPWLPLVFHSVAASALLGITLCACVSWTKRPYVAYICAFCLAYSAAGAISLLRHAHVMASVNKGLALILSDVSGGAMQALLDRSNHDDEYLHLMLLTTGYLRRVDETPPWLCLPLPPPLHTLRHPTMSAYAFGYADISACIPVTSFTLHISGLAFGLVAVMACTNQCRLWAASGRCVKLEHS